MEAHRRNQTIARYRAPGVIPLELWDLWVDGHLLWDALREPAYPQSLAKALAEVRGGGGTTRSDGRVPDCIAGFDALFVTGGRSVEWPLRAALNALDLPVIFSRDPSTPGRFSGSKLLAQHGGRHPWVCDLGQAGLKLCSSDATQQFPRDLQNLPIRMDRADESIPEQRTKLRHWLAESLRTFARRTAPADSLLFALPSRLDDAGVPEGSSYIGMRNDASLIGDVIDGSGLRPKFVFTLNDAELAALDAIDEPGLHGATKIFVMTLGFGFGAALVSRGH